MAAQRAALTGGSRLWPAARQPHTRPTPRAHACASSPAAQRATAPKACLHDVRPLTKLHCLPACAALWGSARARLAASIKEAAEGPGARHVHVRAHDLVRVRQRGGYHLRRRAGHHLRHAARATLFIIHYFLDAFEGLVQYFFLPSKVTITFLRAVCTCHQEQVCAARHASFARASLCLPQFHVAWRCLQL